MEYIRKAEEINQQSQSEPETSSHFKSLFAINGQSILSPLMTPEKRLEMQKLRQAAIDVEQNISQRPRKTYAGKGRGCESMNHSVRNCCKTRNVSTNTELELELVLRPVTVVGRIRQTLQLSETLIYDNSCNAIIKFIKPKFSRTTSVQHHVVHEDFSGSSHQQAVIMLPAPQYGILTNTLYETAEPLSKGVIADAPSAAKPSPDLEVIRKNDKEPTWPQSLRQMLDVATRPKIEQRERSITSPVLHQTAACSDHLDPLIWKRYYSEPSSYGSDVKHAVEPKTFNPIIKPPTTATTTKVTPTKIQGKQQHSSSIPKSSQSKCMSNSKSVKRTTLPRSNISYSAHASSHANAVQQGSKDGVTRISSTQRRLSYDPLATTKRAATLKKTDSSSSCAARIPPSTSSSNSNGIAAASPTAECSNSEMVKSQLQEMEQQQRQRFQLLISQQAEEQKRMQKEFLAQQQALMEQMICNMTRLTYDKDALSDPANSESSSINSLPQSHVDLQIDEPGTDV